jgi:deoxyribodipyrimidine photo-lyase
MTVLLWLRRDLRLHDNPAVHAALATGEPVVPAFCFDDRLLHGRHVSGPRTQFLLECLADLDRSLRELGSGLIVRRGRPETELPALARQLDARTVLASSDVSPYAARRDRVVSERLSVAGVQTRFAPGLFAVDEPESIRTADGGPYALFTPFYRSWLSHPRREVLTRPRALPPLPASLAASAVPTLAELDLTQTVPDPVAGGEHAGRTAMTRFLTSQVGDYRQGLNELGQPSCSRLSPFLHFGCISPRELEQRLPSSEGATAFRRQLCWRDFYAQVLRHHPRNARSEYQHRYRATLRWSHDHARFDAWRQGRTGFPLVDAGMRQLLREGWMHNRARLVVGSFLTKDLGIDWRWGERWFMRMLLDGDEANNNGNWQWIASVGVDPQPAFRRILSPTRQQQRHDPHGDYVRHYVPELSAVPDRHLAEPWTMPRAAQVAAGCRIGHDYPSPIVDHAQARRDALARYAKAHRATHRPPQPSGG